MNTLATSFPRSVGLQASNRLAAVAKTAVCRLLTHIHGAHLTLTDDDSVESFGDPESSVKGEMTVTDSSAYLDILLRGGIGAAEAYVDGKWHSPNLTAVIQVFAINIGTIDRIQSGISSLLGQFNRALHWWNRNTRRGAKRNIRSHYDLSNELFSRLLDKRMMYSSAIYPDPESTLDEASEYKLRRICDKLQLCADDHLLEIGTGWGGLAIFAASEYGCRVTTTTISQEQFDYAQAEIQRHGLADRIELVFKDYRELAGAQTFDKIVSVEMIEAVGHRYYPVFFDHCARLLKDDGLMLMQAILIADHRYQDAIRKVDFIQRYIFPGSCIPSVSALTGAMRDASDFRVVHLEDISADYATTLQQWRERLLADRSHIASMAGFDEAFVRLWDFYFAYCEGGFRERNISNAQIIYARPRAKQDRLLGDRVQA